MEVKLKYTGILQYTRIQVKNIQLLNNAKNVKVIYIFWYRGLIF